MATNTASEDQRRRTMEALERRFAAAKAEALQKVKHGKKGLHNDDEKETPRTNSSAAALSPHLTDTSVKNSPNPSSKKGNFSFLGYIASQDLEECGPTYSQLSESIHENLLPSNVKPSSKRVSTVDKVLHELFQSGDSAQKYLQGSRSMKIDNWILLDNYVQGRGASIGSRIKALRSHSKRSRKHMSMKQLKRSGTFDLPLDMQKFEKYKPMHEMWKGYSMQLLKTTGKNQLAQCLLSADLHGASILVAECKITAFTGVSGIMIRETAETFGIVTQDDKFRVVPKKGSVFMFQVDCWKITLLGDKLTTRNLES